jgi:hypothetical protein
VPQPCDRAPRIERESETVVVQRGEISSSGFGPVAIEFPVPFLGTPKVEVINLGGYSQSDVLRVEAVTPHQVVFRRSSSGGIGGTRMAPSV